MKFRYTILLSLILIGILALAIYFINQYLDLFPASVNSSFFLWVAAVSAAAAFLSQMKDVIELTERLFGGKAKKRPSNKEVAPCNTPIIHGFGEVWYRNPDIRSILKCPPSPGDIEIETHITFQSFQHGEMFEVSPDTNNTSGIVYVLFDDDGTFQRFDGKLHTFDIEYLEHTYRADYAIDSKFAGIYWRMTSWHIKQRLGKPTASSQNTYGACQQFTGGRMFWLQISNNIYALLEQEVDSNKRQTWKKFADVAWWQFQK